MDINIKLTIASITDYFLYNIGQTDTEIYQMRQRIADIIKNFIKKLNEDSISSSQDLLIEHLTLVVNVCRSNNEGFEGITYINNGFIEHATCQIIKYNASDEVYEHYFFNSGAGIKSTDGTGNMIHQWKFSNYGEVNPILEHKSAEKEIIETDNSLDSEGFYKELMNSGYYTSQNYFFTEMQLQGNCAMRSLIFPIYLIIRIQYKNVSDEYLIYLMNLVKLMIIDENIDDIFSEDNISFEDKLSMKFFIDLLIKQREEKLFQNTRNNYYQEIIKEYYDKIIRKLKKLNEEKTNKTIYNEPGTDENQLEKFERCQDFSKEIIQFSGSNDTSEFNNFDTIRKSYDYDDESKFKSTNIRWGSYSAVVINFTTYEESLENCINSRDLKTLYENNRKIINFFGFNNDEQHRPFDYFNPTNGILPASFNYEIISTEMDKVSNPYLFEILQKRFTKYINEYFIPVLMPNNAANSNDFDIMIPPKRGVEGPAEIPSFNKYLIIIRNNLKIITDNINLFQNNTVDPQSISQYYPFYTILFKFIIKINTLLANNGYEMKKSSVALKSPTENNKISKFFNFNRTKTNVISITSRIDDVYMYIADNNQPVRQEFKKELKENRADVYLPSDEDAVRRFNKDKDLNIEDLNIEDRDLKAATIASFLEYNTELFDNYKTLTVNINLLSLKINNIIDKLVISTMSADAADAFEEIYNEIFSHITRLKSEFSDKSYFREILEHNIQVLISHIHKAIYEDALDNVWRGYKVYLQGSHMKICYNNWFHDYISHTHFLGVNYDSYNRYRSTDFYIYPLEVKDSWTKLEKEHMKELKFNIDEIMSILEDINPDQLLHNTNLKKPLSVFKQIEEGPFILQTEKIKDVAKLKNEIITNQIKGIVPVANGKILGQTSSWKLNNSIGKFLKCYNLYVSNRDYFADNNLTRILTISTYDFKSLFLPYTNEHDKPCFNIMMGKRPSPDQKDLIVELDRKHRFNYSYNLLGIQRFFKNLKTINIISQMNKHHDLSVDSEGEEEIVKTQLSSWFVGFILLFIKIMWERCDFEYDSLDSIKVTNDNPNKDFYNVNKQAIINVAAWGCDPSKLIVEIFTINVKNVNFEKIGMNYDRFQKFIKDILICFSFFKEDNKKDDVEAETKAGSIENPISEMSKHEKLAKENLKQFTNKYITFDQLTRTTTPISKTIQKLILLSPTHYNLDTPLFIQDGKYYYQTKVGSEIEEPSRENFVLQYGLEGNPSLSYTNKDDDVLIDIETGRQFNSSFQVDSRVRVTWARGLEYLGKVTSKTSIGKYVVTYNDGMKKSYNIITDDTGKIYAYNNGTTYDMHTFTVIGGQTSSKLNCCVENLTYYLPYLITSDTQGTYLNNNGVLKLNKNLPSLYNEDDGLKIIIDIESFEEDDKIDIQESYLFVNNTIDEMNSNMLNFFPYIQTLDYVLFTFNCNNILKNKGDEPKEVPCNNIELLFLQSRINFSYFIFKYDKFNNKITHVYESSWIELESFETKSMIFKRKETKHVTLIPVNHGFNLDSAKLDHSKLSFYFVKGEPGKFDDNLTTFSQDIRCYFTDSKDKNLEFVAKPINITIENEKLSLFGFLKNDVQKKKIIYLMYNLYFTNNYDKLMEVFMFVYQYIDKIFTDDSVKVPNYLGFLTSFFDSFKDSEKRNLLALTNALPPKYKKILDINLPIVRIDKMKIDSRATIPLSNDPTFVTLNRSDIIKLAIPVENLMKGGILSRKNVENIEGLKPEFQQDLDVWIQKYRNTIIIEKDRVKDLIEVLSSKVVELNKILTNEEKFNGEKFDYNEYIEKHNREDRFGFFTSDPYQTIYLLIKSRIRLYETFISANWSKMIHEIQRYQDIFNLSGYCYEKISKEDLQINQLEEQIGKLQENLAKITSDSRRPKPTGIDDKNIEIERLKKNLTDLQTLLNQRPEEIDATNVENTNLKEARERLNKEIKILSKKINDLQYQLDERPTKREMEMLLADNKQLQTIIENLQEDIGILKMELSQRSPIEDVMNQDKENRTLKETILRLETEIRYLQTQISKTPEPTDIDDKNIKIRSLETTIKKIREELINLRTKLKKKPKPADIDDKSREIRKLKETIEKLRGDIKTLEDQLSGIPTTGDIEDRDRTIENLRTQISKCIEDKELLQKTLDEMSLSQSDIEILRSELTSKTDQIEQLEKQIIELSRKSSRPSSTKFKENYFGGAAQKLQTIREIPVVVKINSLYVTFEYLSGMMLRQPQYDTLTAMFGNMCDTLNYHKIYQLIMGAGKSSVIIPLACLVLNSFNYIPITILPSHLVNQMAKSLSILSYFGISVDFTTLNINRTNDLYSFDLENKIRKNKVYICSDLFLKSYLLMLVENKAYNKMVYDRGIWNQTFFLFDEVDEISDPFKCELVYPTGLKTDSNFENIEIKHIYNIYYNFIKVYFLDDGYIKKSNIPGDWERDKSDLNQKLRKEFSNEVKWKKFLESINLESEEIEFEKLLSNDNALFNRIKDDDFKLRSYIIVYQLLKQVLNSCLNLQFNLNYGIGYTREKEYPLLGNIAIPYSKQNTPAKGSEFSDIRITIFLSILSYLYSSAKSNYSPMSDDEIMPTILREIDINDMINNYIIEASNDITGWKDSISIKKFTTLLNTMDREYTFPNVGMKITDFKRLPRNKMLSQTEKNMEHFKILKDYLLSKFNNLVRFNSQKISATFSDIISSQFNSNRSGFTGTPYIDLPIDFNNTKILCQQPVIRREDEGQIYYSIINKESNITIEEETDKKKFDIDAFIDILIGESTSKKQYDVLIDVGSYLSAVGIDGFISKMKVKDNKIVVCYFDENDEIVVPELEKGQRYFYLFDQKHTVGTDLKLPPKYKGLLTISLRNGLRDVIQGAYRLRKLLFGQTLDYYTNFDFRNTKQDTHISLLSWLKEKEGSRKANNKKLQDEQNIRTLAREFFIIKGKNQLAYDYNSIYSHSWYNITTNIPYPLTSDDLNKKIKLYQIQDTQFLYDLLVENDYKFIKKIDKLVYDEDSDDGTVDVQLQQQEQQQTQQQEQQQKQINISQFDRAEFGKVIPEIPGSETFNSESNLSINKGYAPENYTLIVDEEEIKIYKSCLINKWFYNYIATSDSETKDDDVDIIPMVIYYQDVEKNNRQIIILSADEAVNILSSIDPKNKAKILLPPKYKFLEDTLFRLLQLQPILTNNNKIVISFIEMLNMNLHKHLRNNYFYTRTTKNTNDEFLLQSFGEAINKILIAKVSCDCIIKFDELIADIIKGEYGKYMDFFKHLQILNSETMFMDNVDQIIKLFQEKKFDNDKIQRQIRMTPISNFDLLKRSIRNFLYDNRPLTPVTTPTVSPRSPANPSQIPDGLSSSATEQTAKKYHINLEPVLLTESTRNYTRSKLAARDITGWDGDSAYLDRSGEDYQTYKKDTEGCISLMPLRFIKEINGNETTLPKSHFVDRDLEFEMEKYYNRHNRYKNPERKYEIDKIPLSIRLFENFNISDDKNVLFSLIYNYSNDSQKILYSDLNKSYSFDSADKLTKLFLKLPNALKAMWVTLSAEHELRDQLSLDEINMFIKRMKDLFGKISIKLQALDMWSPRWNKKEPDIKISKYLSDVLSEFRVLQDELQIVMDNFNRYSLYVGIDVNIHGREYTFDLKDVDVFNTSYDFPYLRLKGMGGGDYLIIAIVDESFYVFITPKNEIEEGTASWTKDTASYIFDDIDEIFSSFSKKYTSDEFLEVIPSTPIDKELLLFVLYISSFKLMRNHYNLLYRRIKFFHSIGGNENIARLQCIYRMLIPDSVDQIDNPENFKDVLNKKDLPELERRKKYFLQEEIVNFFAIIDEGVNKNYMPVTATSIWEEFFYNIFTFINIKDVLFQNSTFFHTISYYIWNQESLQMTYEAVGYTLSGEYLDGKLFPFIKNSSCKDYEIYKVNYTRKEVESLKLFDDVSKKKKYNFKIIDIDV